MAGMGVLNIKCTIMKDLRTTNILLLIIVVPMALYLLKLLSFIFVPLVFSMFITLLFLPLMRWLHKNQVPRAFSIILIITMFIGILKLGGELIQMTIREVASAEGSIIDSAEDKLMSVIVSVEDFFGVDRIEGENIFVHYFRNNSFLENFGSTINFIGDTLSMILMTFFFTILLLSESVNFQTILNKTLIDSRYSSIKTFVQIENDILKFVKVKFFISLLTGIGFSVVCLLFGVSFPILWGLLAFAINFIQLVGSIVSVVLLGLFGFVELDPSSSLLLFVLSLTAVQVLFGSILEPIMMGKTFSVNIVTVLIMLMLWGYLWGIAGLIMAIPITVFLKIILEQFPRTKVIAGLMGGYERSVKVPWKKRVATVNADDNQMN
jgi:AI-2 transport protein TqsA